jgi:hypothetical protein
MSCLEPYVSPDFALLDDLKEAVRNRESDKLDALTELSELIYQYRSAQAFNSPVTVNGGNLSNLPSGIFRGGDQAIEISSDLDKKIAEGLGLTIPGNLPLEQYIELSQDFRKRIVSLTRKIAKSASRNAATAEADLLAKEIININSEIERIKGLNRNIVLQAAIEFYESNSMLVNTTLAAGAMGLSTGLPGCAEGAITAGAATIAKSKFLKSSPATSRFARTIKNGVEPYLDKLVSKYLGTTTHAINVMTLRKTILDQSGSQGNKNR